MEEQQVVAAANTEQATNKGSTKGMLINTLVKIQELRILGDSMELI